MRLLTALLITLLFTSSIHAATATFTWHTELCEIKGTYDPKKYTAEQLQNTYDLWFTYASIHLETQSVASEPSDIPKLSLAKLTDEYTKKKQHYNEMKIINTPYWQELKAKRIQELDDEYDLAKTDMQAYSDATVLTNNRFTQSCPDIAKILASNDTMKIYTFWKAFAQAKKNNNASPERYMEIFNSHYNSDQKLAYAKIDLIGFGWHNCVNQTIKRVNQDGTQEHEFNKLFSNIKSKCDEP